MVALTIFGGVMGFDLIMRMQTWIMAIGFLVTGLFSRSAGRAEEAVPVPTPAGAQA